MTGAVVTKIEGEVYTHRLLWQTVRRLMKLGEDPKGAFYPHLSAMLMLYFVVEGYLNFILDVMDPEAFANEKKNFGSDLSKKAVFVFNCVGLKLEKGREPFQGIARLEVLRDKVVHAKPERYDKEIVGVDPDDLPFMQPGEIDRRVSLANCELSRECVREFCATIHAAALARASDEQRRRLGPEALDGSTQMQTSASRISR